MDCEVEMERKMNAGKGYVVWLEVVYVKGLESDLSCREKKKKSEKLI